MPETIIDRVDANMADVRWQGAENGDQYGLGAGKRGFSRGWKIVVEIAAMRLILVGAVSLLALRGAWAAESLTLGKHTVACQFYQDIIDMNIKDRDSLQKLFPSLQLWGKYINRTCREYAAGTSVDIEKETRAQGLNFECVRARNEPICFWIIKE